jgi:site-specific DNA-adenine methylase
MPTIAYPGGKSRLAHTIVSFFPQQGRIFADPFVGRGNLYFAAVASGLKFKEWWLNDPKTCDFFKAITSMGHKLKVPRRCRVEYERQRAAYVSGDPEAILLEPYLSFSGAGYFGGGCKGGDGSTNHGVSAHGYEKALRECHRIIKKTVPKLTAVDWREMGLQGLRESDFVILDPPYPDSDVRSYSDSTVNYEELVDILLKAKFRWVLCGYLHPVLHRLGTPFWARDVQLLCNRDYQQRRTECLWRNFSDDNGARHSLPANFDSKLRVLDEATSLSFVDLDREIDQRLQTVANDWNDLVPYLLEMNRRLSAPGRRTDLRKGAPAGLTWTAWVESKRSNLGRSLRSVQRLLRGKTEASRNWKARPHLTTLSRGVHGSMPQMPDSAMAIAFEMARLILEMRSQSRNTRLNKRRLERLATRFLAVAERRTEQRRKSPSAERIGIANRIPSAATLIM